MESSKHSLQNHLLLLSSSTSSSSTSSSSTSSCTTLLDSSSYAAATSTTTTTTAAGGNPHLYWTPNIFLNSPGSFSSFVNGGGALANSRINPRQQNDVLVSSLDSTMTHQDLSFDWAHDSAGSTATTTFNNNPHQDLQFSHIKRELSSDSYSKKFSELISSPSSSTIEEDMQNKEHTTDINDMNHVKLLLRTLSSSGGHHHHQNSNSSGLQDFYSTSSSTSSPPPHDPINPPHHKGTSSTFSQIYPTINISSNFNNHQTSSSSLPNSSSTTNFDMNLQALDLFQYSARFGGASTTLRQPFMQEQLDLSSRRNGGLSYYGLHDDNYMQRPLTSTNMAVLPFSSGGVAAETKQSDDVLLLETKAPANKRSRLEPRASCTPFKVRKEKLGDRIAALQQLVAPFGKTDTASVLMEAIGYIKFLQSQVETLSVPYLKSSRNKTHHQRAVQVGTINEERKRDLRSRGLCLVPLSCLSYMTDSGGAVWPPPNFGGGT